MFGEMDLVLIGGIALLFFGPGKIPDLMKGLGKGVREFKKAQSDFESEIKKAVEPPEVKTTKPE
ncbi:MAG: twin-arginine translocase TatA/TatE family subunit [Chlorobiaceae bacterium]|nr:twin-arginine translocase TatA/TatE family subunit [Chlorobiaceae bacterium]